MACAGTWNVRLRILGMPGNSKLQLRIYRTLDELQEIRPQWEDLLSSYPLSTTFSTWEWLSAWWRAFGGNQELLVIGAFNFESRLIGLLPLSITRVTVGGFLPLKLLRLMSDGSQDSDNLDLPIRPGLEDEVTSCFMKYLKENKPLWDICQLNTMPSSSPMGATLTRQLTNGGWALETHRRISCAIPLPATFAEYVQQLSSEDQKNIGRYTRRLEKRYETRIYRCSQKHEVLRALDAMFELHQARWQAVGEKGSFGSAQRRKFYHELSELLLERGWLELWALELDSVIAAVQYAFRYGTTVFQLQEGFDSSRSSDRVGFVLRGKVLEQLITDGVQKYDFLAGPPGYKARWSAQPGCYHDLHFAPPFSLGASYLKFVNDAARSKEWLRAHLPKSAWRALHWVNPSARRQSPKKRDLAGEG